MSASQTHIMNLLEMRFDYQSARNVFANWCKSSSIKSEPVSLDDAQLKSLLAYLTTNAPEAKRVHGAIERLILNTKDDAPVAVDAPAAVDDAPAAVDAAPAAVDDAPAASEDAASENNGKKKRKGKK